MKPEDKLLKLVELVQTDTITPKELEQFILLVLNVIKESKDKFEQMSEEGIQKIQEALDYMDKEHKEHEEEMSSEMKGMMSKCDEMCKEALAKMDKATKMVEEIKPIPPPPLETIAYEASKLVEDKLTPLIPKAEDIANEIIGEKTRDALEKLTGDERLDKSAIRGLDEELKRISEIKGAVRGGGVSAGGVRQAFKYIFHTEQPTGAIDGNNTTYTVKNDIWAIISFTINGESVAELPNYTFINKTITFASAIPAVYSGKDFECKYIG